MVTYHSLILHESSWMESFINPPHGKLDESRGSSWARKFPFKGRGKGVRANQPPTGEGPITPESTPPPNVPIP